MCQCAEGGGGGEVVDSRGSFEKSHELAEVSQHHLGLKDWTKKNNSKVLSELNGAL